MQCVVLETYNLLYAVSVWHPCYQTTTDGFDTPNMDIYPEANIGVSTQHRVQQPKPGVSSADYFLSQDMEWWPVEKWLAEDIIVHFATKARVTI